MILPFLLRLLRILVAGAAIKGVLSMLDRYFSWRWVGNLLHSVRQVKQLAPDSGDRKVCFEKLAELPAPVERYLRYALREGQPMIRSVRLGQTGELRISAEKRTWRPFHAVQFVCTDPPGFVWDAQVTLPLKTTVCVRDSYIAGRGEGKVTLFGFLPFPMRAAPSSHQLNEGELMRYLAEAVWYPTALLPGQGVEWTPVSDDQALATLTDGATTVAMEFRFGEHGEVTSVSSPARPRQVGNTYIATPWEGIHRNYREQSGMQIPTDGEVKWHLCGEAVSVWKGHLQNLEWVF